MERKKIGLLGGTFDPIHYGHLNLAFELMEKRSLDEVWFIPARVSPLKMDNYPQAMENRLAMVQLAIEEIPQFHLKDLEKDRPSPSYTIDTIKIFVEEESASPNPHQFYLLLGDDAIKKFGRWHLPEEIIQLAPLLVGSRTGVCPEAVEELSPSIQRVIQEGVTKIPLMDISATGVRYRISHGLYCGHLVPAPVLNYIKNEGLYTRSLE